MHPPRHALAALLLEQGHVAEAEHVYRDDLGMSENVRRCATASRTMSGRSMVSSSVCNGAAMSTSFRFFHVTLLPLKRGRMCRSRRRACAGRARMSTIAAANSIGQLHRRERHLLARPIVLC